MPEQIHKLFPCGWNDSFPIYLPRMLDFPHGTLTAISTFLPHWLQRVLNVAALTFFFAFQMTSQRHTRMKSLVVNVPRVRSTLQDECDCCRRSINGPKTHAGSLGWCLQRLFWHLCARSGHKRITRNTVMKGSACEIFLPSLDRNTGRKLDVFIAI